MAKAKLIKPVRNSFVGSVEGLSLYSVKDVCPFDHLVCKHVCVCVSWYVDVYGFRHPIWTRFLCERFAFHVEA